MKQLTVPVVLLMVAFMSNVSSGQVASGIPEEIIRELDSLVGRWKIVGKVGDMEVTGWYECVWSRTEDQKKVCLVGRFKYQTGELTRSGMNLIGWNSTKKCIEDRGFDANGGNATLYWTVKSQKEYQGELLMVDNGKEVRSTAILIKKGPSEIVMESESETGEVARYVMSKAGEVVGHLISKAEVQIKAARAQINALETMLDIYQLDIGSYPTTQQGLQALRVPPPDLVNPSNWTGPYARKDIPTDPWSKPYYYELLGPRQYRVYSAGPDGQVGTEDDIGR